MKKTTFIITLFLFSIAFSNAQSLLFSAGLATPSDKFNQVYNKDILSDWRGSAKLGYFFGAKLKVPIDNFSLSLGAAYNHFPEADVSVNYNGNDYKLSISNNIIPISAGVNYYFVKNVVGVYALGELSYNYIFSTVDFNGIPLPSGETKSPTDNRIGFGFGVGVDFDIKIAVLNLEAKYNLANQIGAKSGEPKKSYFNLGIGFGF